MLILAALHATPALAQNFDPLDNQECDETDPDADTEGCLEHQGSNRTNGSIDNEGEGGDGVAGSNVIGVAGAGDSNITANNQSGFATARGGDVEANNNLDLNTGPELNVYGGDTTVTSVATGNALVTQQATPTILASLDQLATSSGESNVSNTASASNVLNAANNATGAANVSQTVTGASPVTGTAGPINATATATGVGPVTQTVTQGPATVNNLISPVVSTTATNTATISGSAPVNQTGAASTDPTAIASAEPNNTRGRLFHRGSNSTRGSIDNAGVGGDGVAGSNVIGVAGAGDSVINATNQSDFADGQGGNVEASNDVAADNGPDLNVYGGDTNVTSIATGVARVDQNAAPVITIDLTQDATSRGVSNVSNTATASNVLNAANNVTGTGNVSQTVTGASPVTGTAGSPVTATATATGVGPVNQSITQGASSVSNTAGSLGPAMNFATGNSANLTGVAPVNQTAAAVTNPVAVANGGPNNTLGTLLHRGSNRLALDIDNAGAGGDGVAGSNVIGVAGVGDSTITANNSSDFAKGIGGDAEATNNVVGDNGPDLNVYGSDVNVTAIARGSAFVTQTAAPVITLDLTQSSSSSGISTGGSGVSQTGVGANTATLTSFAPVTQAGIAITNPTAIAGTGPGPGGVSLSSSASGNSGVDQSARPNLVTPLDQASFIDAFGNGSINVIGGNDALIIGSSPIAQTGFSISNPFSAANP